MEVHNSEDEATKASRTYDEAVIEALTLYCNMLWQDASDYTKNKYWQYALKEEKLLEKINSYGSDHVDMLLDMAVTLIERVAGVVNPEGLDTEDVAVVGRLLRVSSFLCVIFGGEAHLGDVEYFLKKIYQPHEFRKKSNTPRKAFKAYMQGDSRQFLDDMHERLMKSVKAIPRIRRDRLAGRHMVHGAPSIWKQGPNGYKIDKEVLNSNYHLLASLLRYLEAPAGRA